MQYDIPSIWRYGGLIIVVAALLTAFSDNPAATSRRQPLDGPDGGVSADDRTYITVAANGEKIPHPASTKTYAVQDGATTVQVPEGMVYVPAGPYVMGNGTTSHKVTLSAYSIGKYLVT